MYKKVPSSFCVAPFYRDGEEVYVGEGQDFITRQLSYPFMEDITAFTKPWQVNTTEAIRELQRTFTCQKDRHLALFKEGKGKEIAHEQLVMKAFMLQSLYWLNGQRVKLTQVAHDVHTFTHAPLNAADRVLFVLHGQGDRGFVQLCSFMEDLNKLNERVDLLKKLSKRGSQL